MFLLFDIGGTNTRMAVSRGGESFEEPVIFQTPSGFDEAISLFKKTALELTGGGLTAIVGGLPGILNKDKSSLLDAPNLKDWSGKPIKSELEKAFGAPVFLENDAALAALGEAVYGAGRGKRIVAYFTVSTGVGGARVVDGVIDRSAFGFEPWRQIIDGTHRLGYYISGNGIRKRFGKAPEDIDDSSVWEEAERWLAVGINNAIAFWSPDIIVVGGTVAMRRFSLERVAARLRDIANFPELPEIVPAELGDKAGLYGALKIIEVELPWLSYG